MDALAGLRRSWTACPDVNVTPVRLAFVMFAFVKLAPVNRAFERFTPEKSAFVRLADEKLTDTHD